MIDYDIEALRDNIKAAKKNIETFEKAIEGEHNTIAEYRRMIEILEQKAALAEGITIDANALN